MFVAMSDLNKLDSELNQMILQGQALDAFEKFYADDVVMIEGTGEAHEGKDANRKREQEFFASIKEFHGAECNNPVVGDGVSYSEWTMEVTFQNDQRVKMEQACRRVWKDGKVVNERFYYNAP